MITLYGISNCDTVKKARQWLEQQGIDYQFHDLRRDGLTAPMLEQWEQQLGWEQLLNRRSTSWKQLPAATREQIDRQSALVALLDHPTLVKRPVLDTGHELAVGFKPANYARLFKQHNL